MAGRAGLPGFDAQALRAGLRELEFSGLSVPRSHEQDYLAYYRIDFANRIPGVVHHFGRLPAAGFDIACHYYLPPRPRGTCLLVHGYFDHTGLYGKLIEHCLPVDRDRSRHQTRRVGHVSQPLRVHEHSRIRAVREQRARATGMVEVHVRGDDPAYGFRRHAGERHRFQDATYRSRRAGLDDGRLVAVPHQKARRKAGPQIARVDAVHPVSQILDHACLLMRRLPAGCLL